jgi:23S rRNA (cytosine1962-C5)-methyltransferase
MDLPVIRLKPREDKRLRIGHAWVFSNEVDTVQTPLKGLQAGQLTAIQDSSGRTFGLAYVNPNALICARLLTRRVDARIDADWLSQRLARALALRERLYDRPFYRLVYGESDGLPGLIVDRYGDVCVVQIGTAGMERLKAEIIQALKQVLKPAGILLRNDGSVRELENLPSYVEEVGSVPERVEIEEEGARFSVQLKSGQKTGWYFDQRDNRSRLARYVKGARVLDVYSYVGAWGVRAALAGAKAVTCVDSSAPALAMVRENAALNGVSVATREGDARDVLKALKAEGERFDMVVLDPPALIKRRKDIEAGAEHYAQLNRLAMQLLENDGILVSASCSHHMSAEHLQRLLLRESRSHARQLQILEQGTQGPDHPVHPAIPETSYLKAFFCRLTG